MNPRSGSTHERWIPVAGTTTIEERGDYFLIVESNVPVEIMRDGAPFTSYSQGDGEELPEGETFTRLTIKNASDVAARVIVYAGFGRRRTNRQAVMEPKTEFDAWAGTELPLNAGQTFTGSPTGWRLRRKCIQVTNEDTTLKLQVRDSASHVGLIVFPETSVTLPISEAVEIFNPNGSPVSCRISEIWWTA